MLFLRRGVPEECRVASSAISDAIAIGSNEIGRLELLLTIEDIGMVKERINASSPSDECEAIWLSQQEGELC